MCLRHAIVRAVNFAGTCRAERFGEQPAGNHQFRFSEIETCVTGTQRRTDGSAESQQERPHTMRQASTNHELDHVTIIKPPVRQ